MLVDAEPPTPAPGLRTKAKQKNLRLKVSSGGEHGNHERQALNSSVDLYLSLPGVLHRNLVVWLTATTTTGRLVLNALMVL